MVEKPISRAEIQFRFILFWIIVFFLCVIGWWIDKTFFSGQLLWLMVLDRQVWLTGLVLIPLSTSLLPKR